MFRMIALAPLAAALLLGRSAQAGSDIVTLGLDMQVSGNGPRSAASIDQCLSVPVGQLATVDVAVPDPGIPADRGISAYQFTFFYDRTVVSLTGDDSGMLLKQAPGSALFPFAEPKPDTDGVYTSAAVDFGPKGIEPAGASEVGPGVLARLTLTPHTAGVSGLVIKDVVIKDNDGDDIEIISILSAHLYVGQPCPGQAASTPTTTSAPTAPATARSSVTGSDVTGSAPLPAELIQAGGRPGKPGGSAPLLLAMGALALLAGTAALAAAGAARRRL